jgi:hypothetical protein
LIGIFSFSLELLNELIVDAPSPLAGEGHFTAKPKLIWVRVDAQGPLTRLAQARNCAAELATLSRKGEGEISLAATPA